MIIVPEDAELIAEVEVLNKDVGFVTEGQDVRVKLDTFPFTKHGLVNGKISDIADDAIENEALGLVFKARINLLDNQVKVDGKTVKLHPGMSVSAEIKTGERRAVELFLGAFQKTADESFNER